MQGTYVWILETPACAGNDYHNFDWYLAENGQRPNTTKQVDFFGGVTLSAPVLATVSRASC